MKIRTAVASLAAALTLTLAPAVAQADTYVPANPADGITAADFPYPDDAHVHSCKNLYTLRECSKLVDDMQWGIEFNHGLLFLARYTLQETQAELAATKTALAASQTKVGRLEALVDTKDATIARLRARAAARSIRR